MECSVACARRGVYNLVTPRSTHPALCGAPAGCPIRLAKQRGSCCGWGFISVHSVREGPVEALDFFVGVEQTSRASAYLKIKTVSEI